MSLRKKIPYASAALLILIMTLPSCHEEGEKGPVDIITITADQLYYDGASEDWVVAWNSEGDLLDYKPYVKNQKVVLTTTGNIIDNKITVALVSWRVDFDVKNCYIGVFTDVPVGQEFNRNSNFNPGFPEMPSDLPRFTLNVDVTEDLRGYSLSNKYGFVSVEYAQEASIETSFDPRSTNYNFMYRTPDAVKHKFITDLKEGDEISISGADLVPYENEFTVNFPSYHAIFIFLGYEPGISIGSHGYIMDRYYSWDPITSIKTGYMNRVSKFFFHLNLISSHAPVNSMTYMKRGSLPGDIVWPDLTKYTRTGENPTTFTVAGDNIKFTQVFWAGGTPTSQTQLAINSPQLSPKIGKLPDEIAKGDPAMDFETMGFLKADLYVGGYSYQEHMKQLMNLQGETELEATYVSLEREH